MALAMLAMYRRAVFHIMCRGRNSENGEVLGQQRLLSTGILGNGTDESANEPMDVSTLSGVSSLSSGVGHACARQPVSNVWCWGGNGMGQLGLGEEEVTEIFGGVNEPALTVAGTESLGSGEYHTCVVLDAYTMRCWGMNMYGQVGTGQLPEGGTGTDQTLAQMPLSRWQASTASLEGKVTHAPFVTMAKFFAGAITNITSALMMMSTGFIAR